jgi:2-dehydropantoate 2-reductase
MKILVLGAGALGGYYGARLAQAGADVTFLVRPKRSALLVERGLCVHSPLGDFHGQVNTVLAQDINSHYDAVLLTCKAYDLDSAVAAIKPAVGPATVIVPLPNGLAAYDSLDQHFGRERVMGGVAYIATSLNDSGEIVHLSELDRLSMGARSDRHVGVARAFYELVARTPGSRSLSEQIEQELWEKWVMISAGAAITCLMRAPICGISRASEGHRLIEQMLAECIEVARSNGFTPRVEAEKTIRGNLLDPNSKWAASMMRDIAKGAPKIEVDAIVGDMVRRAQAHGLQTPLLRIALCHLQSYEAGKLGS